MSLFVVQGPPCGGKSTWVNERAKPGDIVIDYDRIVNAFTAVSDVIEYGLKRPLATVAYQAREAAIREALQHAHVHDVFVIHSVPRPALLAKYADYGAEVITCDPGRDVVEERCRRLRPESSMSGVNRWYASRRNVPAVKPRVFVGPSKSASRKW